MSSTAVVPVPTVVPTVARTGFEPAPIIKSFTVEDHRRRLLNIQSCRSSIRSCVKTHLITNYLPGQVSYNIGETPSIAPYDPDEYDERELEELANNGIRLIQIMEDWNDLLRLHGGSRFDSPNPAGLRRFIEMAHRVDIKVLLYASSNYMQEDDPDMRPEWTRETPGNGNHWAHWKLIRCSPNSPGWRAYMMQKTLHVLDSYEADGLYNDWGYIPNAASDRLENPVASKPTDEVLAFEETAEHDASEEDLVALIYSEVKRRGGIYKFHADFNNRPLFKENLYDYLWIGEGIGDLEKMRTEGKTHPPYVVPSFDFRFGGMDNDDHQFLHTIPYMQFPQLLAGRPFTGERAVVPGVHYRTEEEDELLQQWRTQWRFTQENPNGPYIYGPWELTPGRPGARENHARWLKQYLPMVEEGTYAFIEIGDSDLFAAPLPAQVVATVFANLDIYLVLANYGKSEVTIETTRTYVATMEENGAPRQTWTLGGETLLLLRQVL
jgi:hypothetical protein